MSFLLQNKNIIIWLIVLALFWWGYLNVLSQPHEERWGLDEWILIQHDEYDFSIKSPSEWDIQIAGESGYRGMEEVKLSLTPPTAFFETPVFVISVLQKNAVDPSIQDILLWVDEQESRSGLVEGVTDRPGYQELLYEEAMLDKYKVVRRRYTHLHFKGSIVEDVYIPRQNDMFIVRLKAENSRFTEVHPLFQEIVNSFETIVHNP